MRRSPSLRLLALVATVAVATTGCGLGADPVHSTPAEVLDALDALHDGAEVRATAELVVDEGELRAALRDDPEAREVLREALGRDGGPDVDALLAELEQARAALAEHALLLATGRDGSHRVAAEYRDRVWADLRVGGLTDLASPTEPAGGQDPRGDVHLDVQLRVDWATASEVLARPDLLGDLDEAAAAVAPLLGTDDLELDAVERVLLGFLAGELVGISGVVGPDLLGGLGLAGDGGAARAGRLGSLRDLDLDPRELAEVALTFDDFRRDGDDTLVDVDLELHAAAELVLVRLAEAPAALGLSFEDVEEARAEVARLPERLTDVAVLRFDEAGVLRQARLDVVDALLQVARAADPADREVEAAARLVAELDATGLFVVLDVEGVGATASVLGEPTATVTPEQLARAVGVLFLDGLATGTATGG